jgi:predicted transcriptional regulator
VPGTGRRDAGALEGEILAVLGAVDRALTPAEVLAQLERPLAYTTVMTTLARLHAKSPAALALPALTAAVLSAALATEKCTEHRVEHAQRVYQMTTGRA